MRCLVCAFASCLFAPVPARPLRLAGLRHRRHGHRMPDHDPQGARPQRGALVGRQHAPLRGGGRAGPAAGDDHVEPPDAVPGSGQHLPPDGGRHRGDPGPYLPGPVHGQKAREKCPGDDGRRLGLLGGGEPVVRRLLPHWREGDLQQLPQGVRFDDAAGRTCSFKTKHQCPPFCSVCVCVRGT